MKQFLKQYKRDFETRQRARDGLPAWVKLVMVATILASMFGTSLVIGAIGFRVHDFLNSALPNTSVSEGIMAAIFGGSFLAEIAPGLVFANYVL